MILLFRVGTAGGERQVEVDLDADLGVITYEEGQLMAAYVRRSGFAGERAWAGAHVLVQLARQLPDVDPEDLLEAAVSDAA